METCTCVVSLSCQVVKSRLVRQSSLRLRRRAPGAECGRALPRERYLVNTFRYPVTLFPPFCEMLKVLIQKSL